MDKVSFGQILRETRERKGLELNATARRLRIRPDILKAIEDGNFAAMPPRGYTRNMVNGYARYLGLNPTEITGMYLDELYAYQVDYASSRKRSSGIELPEDTLSSRRMAERNARSFSRESSAARSRNNRRDRNDDYSRNASARTHQARGSALPNTEYTNFYSGPNGDNGIRSKLPYIIAAAIALLLVILIGWLLFGRGGKEADETVPNVPVTGVSSETGASSSQTADAPKPPTKFTFEYSVDNGATSWIEVYVDGQVMIAEEIVGPSSQSFDCSGILQFICANPSGVTARQDGTELLLQPDADGIVNMTIDFADVLAKWRTDNNVPASTTDTPSDKQATNTQNTTENQTQAQTQDAQQTNTAEVGAYDEGSANANNSGYVDNTGYVDNSGYVDYTYSYGTADGTYYGAGTTNQGAAGYYDAYGNFIYY